MIRKIRKSDLDQVMVIEQACFHDAWKRKDYEYEMYENPYSTIWVLEEEGKIIGYYDLWITFDQAEIANIAVLPEYQGKGYGSFLMKHLEQQAVNEGCQAIGLEVRVGNEKAIALYERNGFFTINTKPGYYKNKDGTFEDAYRMMKGI